MNFNFLFTAILLFLGAYLPMLLTLNILSGCAGRPSEDSAIKIFNGRTALTSEAPWAAALKNERGGMCSGVFIDSRTVLTAAHCFIKDENVYLMDTDKNGKMTKSIKATSLKTLVHPSFIYRMGWFGPIYVKESVMFDLGMVHFLNDQSRDFIKFDPFSSKVKRLGEGLVKVFGFGNSEPDLCDFGQLRVAEFTGVGVLETVFYTKNKVPGRGVTICGDSGGPMVSDGKLIGITSSVEVEDDFYVNLTSESSLSFLKDAWNDLYSSVDRDPENIAGKFNWYFGAKLKGAKLVGADLREANLMQADLIGADLTKANLWGANLTGAYLTGANLTGADLTGANLTNADLTKANLHNAKVGVLQLKQAYTTIPASALEACLYPWRRHIPYKTRRARN